MNQFFNIFMTSMVHVHQCHDAKMMEFCRLLIMLMASIDIQHNWHIVETSPYTSFHLQSQYQKHSSIYTIIVEYNAIRNVLSSQQYIEQRNHMYNSYDRELIGTVRWLPMVRLFLLEDHFCIKDAYHKFWIFRDAKIKILHETCFCYCFDLSYIWHAP